MDVKEFVQGTVCTLTPPIFELLKEILVGDILSFSIVKSSNISKDLLAEKLFDYFITQGIKTNRSFDKQIETFMGDIDAITSPRIAKTPQPKKGDNTPAAVPRSRKYYEKAISIKGIKQPTLRQLLDYSRYMLCLYTGSMNNTDKPVENFDFSSDCLEPNKILDHMKQEEISIVFPPSKRKRFEFKDKYSSEACTIAITSVVLCAILNEKITEGRTND